MGFTEAAIGYVRDATDAQTQYLDYQATIWLILCDQADLDKAKVITTKTIKFACEPSWYAAREKAARAFDNVRDREHAAHVETPDRILYQLQRVASGKENWLGVHAMLSEEAETQLDRYQRLLEKVVQEEAETSSSLTICTTLESIGLRIDKGKIVEWRKKHKVRCMLPNDEESEEDKKIRALQESRFTEDTEPPESHFWRRQKCHNGLEWVMNRPRYARMLPDRVQVRLLEMKKSVKKMLPGTVQDGQRKMQI